MKVRVPLKGDKSKFWEYESFVVNDDFLPKPLPYLVGLDALKYANVDLESLAVKFKDGTHMPITSSGAHLVVKTEIDTFYTQTEVEKLHRRSGHLPAARLINMLNRSEAMNEDEICVLSQQIKKARNHGMICQKYEAKPRRHLCSAYWPEDVVFNQTVAMDVFYLPDGPVLQTVCTHTGFTKAAFIKEKSNRSVWDAFL
ncbi:hypothetical protein FVE85_8591 [Porphyridium purpureum]|uniref:Uncharacterized protein n=1 Tax=Porphyridium purpureum TaxID=35688 RepID=A0A5J4YP95_PORPP|nr:hypothetical protein FVE85_8591 [Porphyridium purpureum]|eukprot:POR0366..scf296_7